MSIAREVWKNLCICDKSIEIVSVFLLNLYIGSLFALVVLTSREIYEQTIESGLPNKDVKVMCLKYLELEKSLGEIERGRGIYVFASNFAHPRFDLDFWNKCHEFEVQHGNEDKFREMLRIKWSVSASYIQKDQTVNLDEAKDKLKVVGIVEDEMAALERQLAPAADKTITKERKVGFVSAGVESQQSDGGMKYSANHEEIEKKTTPMRKIKMRLHKNVSSVIFGGLIRKRDKMENDG